MGLLNNFISFFYFMFSMAFMVNNSIPKPPVPPAPTNPEPMQNQQQANEEKKPEIKKEETIEPKKTEEKPLFSVEQPTIPSLPEARNESGFSVRYPLIPPYAFAVIRWDDANKELVYEIEEPQLTTEEKKTLDLLEEGIKELINLSFISVKDRDTVLVYLEKNIVVLLSELSIELTKESFLKIMYYIYRDFVGLNELEPLMNDYFIEDIECNGVNTPVYVVHRKYRNVKTSLIYTDVKNMMSFVEKIAQKAGRYISYAEPLLDASLPDGTRVQAVFSKDVATRGPSYTLRKFTKTPWSPIALVGKGTATPEIYAYLWMAVEYENSLMIIGGTGTGKTSFVNTVAFFIPPQARIVSIEDSVTGDSEIIIKVNDEIIRTTIQDVEKKIRNKKINIKDVEVITVDDKLKVDFSKPSSFIRHRTTKDIYRVTTSTGRVINATKDHSLFTLTIEGLSEVKPEDLEVNNSYIAVPRTLPIEGKGVFNLNLLDNPKIFKDEFLIGEPVRKIFELHKRKDFNVGKSRYQWWKHRNLIPIKYFNKIKYKFDKKDLYKLYIKSKNKTKLPVIFKLDNDFLRLIGLWLGDGCYDNYNKNRVIFSSNEKESVELYKRTGKKFGMNISQMHDDWSWAINSTVLYKFMKFCLKLDGQSNNKKIPNFVFNLTNEQLKHFICGYYTADGTVSEYEIRCSSQSRDIISGMQSLLLRYGIISRVQRYERADRCIDMIISSHENINLFKDMIGFMQERQQDKLSLMGNKKPNHTCSDKIPLNPRWLGGFNNYRNYFRNYSSSNSLPGRNYMQSFLDTPNLDIPDECFNLLFKLSNSDLLWDKVVKIEKLAKKNRYVYDISVPDTERFVAQNILLHNTKELQLEHENWLPSVARSGVGLTNLVGQKYGEVSLFDLLRASFRQRPDYIIVGEVRGAEAFVLFQAFASIRGNEEIFILKGNKPMRIRIKDLENEDITKYKAISYNTKEKKCEILPIMGWIKHPKKKILHCITTKSGREVTITGDHSVFTYRDGNIKKICGKDLVIGSEIIIPSSIPCGYNNISRINLLEYLPGLRIYAPEYVKQASHKLGYLQASSLTNCKAITDYYSQGIVKKPRAMKSEKFLELMKKADICFNHEDLQVKFDGMSRKRPVFLEVSAELLRLLGYYISEGSLNTSGRNYRIEIYNSNKEVLQDIENCIIKLTGNKPSRRLTDRGWGSAIELSFNHKILYEFIKRYCKTKLKKRVPDFIFGLDKTKIGMFLGALYTGDGSVGNKNIGYYTASNNLANDVAQLLLCFGIVATINKRNREGRKTTDYELCFYANYKKEEFLKYVKPIGKSCKIKEGVEDKKLLGELYCDKVKSIEVLNLDKPEHVYDIAVPGNQNFIGGFGGLLLHNSGHPGMATMHAESVDTMIKRLQTAPINLSGSLIETLASVVVMTQSKIKGKEVRKVSSVDEIIKVSERAEGSSAHINTVFKWDPKTDKFFLNPNSKVFENIAVHYGFTKEQVLKEFKLRTNLLKALFKRKISDFKDVQKVIHEYYKAPEEVLRRYGVI